MLCCFSLPLNSKKDFTEDETQRLPVSNVSSTVSSSPRQYMKCPATYLISPHISLPLDAGSIDTVVFTWTLCSIPNAAQALDQAKRVLKPEGRIIFLEHGRAPDRGVAVWQDRITPIWRRIGGGCHLNRGIDSLHR